MRDTKSTGSGQQEEVEAMEALLSTLQDELRQRYYETGKRLMEVAGMEQEAINRLVDEIIRTRRKLASLRKEKSCPCCTALNDGDSAYCKRCGQKL